MSIFQWPSHQMMPPIHDHDHQQGAEDAMILLMEYGDYPCHQSGEAYFTVHHIKQQLPDQLNFIYRHFPKSPHSEGWKASEAAEAAGSQGKFWEMHNTLYQNSSCLKDCDLVEYADQLDLDIPQFLKDITEHVYHDRIQSDCDSGLEFEVEQTPTFFISIRHQSHQNLEILIQKILEVIQT